MRAKLKIFINKRFNGFLDKRMPASADQQLSNRNIFILPTKFGLAYLTSVLVIFLLGTNYQNNLIILVSYLFVSVFLTGMLYSFFNMSQLQFNFTRNVSGYAGQQVVVPIAIKTIKNRFDLNFSFTNNQTVNQSQIEIGESDVNVPYLAQKRGLHNTGRIKISSEYPFGLFVCWTNLDFNCIVTTYPAKKHFNNLKSNSSQQHEDMDGNNVIEGGDDFGELRQYRAGESNAQIAWKQLARGQGYLTKTTQQELGSTIWLSLNDLPSSPLETKLEMLCFLILDHHKHGVPFGLELDRVEIKPNLGNNHTQACLSLLAGYKQGTPNASGVNPNV
jgi:uncharacterized protein (DUF58 family)